jgi:biopolymer transport protein ExbB
MNAWDLLVRGDAVSSAVAIGLLLMSVASWLVILWKAWMLKMALGDTARSTAAFWQSDSLEDALTALRAMDREALLLPVVEAACAPPVGGLATTADRSLQLTRVMRDALHRVLRRLQSGLVLLATVGSVAPFVGLLGTVWGIYHALIGISGAGAMTIEQVSGPVGEALIMTAAGLAVAIPAVLGYNILGRLVARVEADLDGFARDLRGLLLAQAPTPATVVAG